MTVVTPVTPEQVSALAALTAEMNRFYGESEPSLPGLRLQQINRALFGNPPSAYALLAWNDAQAVGFASYSFLWPAVALGRSIFLKELYVSETARRIGVGETLMRTLAEIAVEHGCRRLEWQTDQVNIDAQRFYAKLGVPVNNSKLCYRAQGETLRQLANGG